MIYEDPDELGYWTGLRPAIDICNEIMPKHERVELFHAAINAAAGHHRAAETFRVRAGYGREAIEALGAGRG